MGLKAQNFDEFLAILNLANINADIWQFVDTESLSVVIPVRVSGDTRDGRIDIRGAKFINNLQRALEKNFTLFDADEKLNTLIRVKVEEGSDFFNIDITEIAKRIIDRMSGNQVTSCILLSILCATGYFIYDNYSETLIEQKKLEANTQLPESIMQHDERMIALLHKTNAEIKDAFAKESKDMITKEASLGRDVQAPIRAYVGSMKKGETISINNSEPQLKKDVIKKMKIAKNTETYKIHADGAYKITGINFENGLVIFLKQGSKEISAVFNLENIAQRQEIINEISDIVNGIDSHINLRLDVEFTQKRIIEGKFINFGLPRENMQHFRLEDIPENIPVTALITESETE